MLAFDFQEILSQGTENFRFHQLFSMQEIIWE